MNKPSFKESVDNAIANSPLTGAIAGIMGFLAALVGLSVATGNWPF